MGSGMQDMPNIGSVRYSSLEEEFSKNKGDLKYIWEPNMSRGIWNNKKVKDLNCSVGLDSIRGNFLTKVGFSFLLLEDSVLIYVFFITYLRPWSCLICGHEQHNY